jgi:hypothetical protein
MSEVATPPVVETPAAAPAAAPVAPPVNDSLLPPLPAATPAAPADWTAKVPEKFHVKGADGAIDLQATLLKQAESYSHLEKTRPAAPPAKPDDYTFTPPDEFKDLKFDDALSASFREKAHKAGLTQAQYEMVLGEYIAVVPQVLDTTLKLSGEEAKAELSKVWQSPAVFEAQMNNAVRAISALPANLQQDVHARFGRDPLALQVLASFGQQTREDRAPVNPDGGAGTPMTLEQIQAHPAYRDPKHPEHAAYSERAVAAAKRATPAV